VARVKIDPIVISVHGIAVPMAKDYLHCHHGHELVDVQNLFKVLEPLVRIDLASCAKKAPQGVESVWIVAEIDPKSLRVLNVMKVTGIVQIPIGLLEIPLYEMLSESFRHNINP
jgi:hypothetical protein